MYSEEISDLIVGHDPETRRRTPVRKREVCELLAARGNRRAGAIVEALPETGGFLEIEHVDALLLRAHCELQRLSEEFQQGRRVRALLAPLLDSLREAGHGGPLRVIDVGCGLGYVVRWLALNGELGKDVELIGADLNEALIRAARRAAAAEGLECRFEVEDAFRLADGPAVFMSTGVVHHFRDAYLPAFFRAQSQSGALAFLHFDIKPTWLSPIGAWIFHQARMREPLARHDGVLSARRAYGGTELLAAAREGTRGFRCAIFDGKRSLLPILHVLHTLVGVRADHWDAFVRRLGDTASRLGPSEVT